MQAAPPAKPSDIVLLRKTPEPEGPRGPRPARNRSRLGDGRGAVGRWLLLLAGMTFVMVLLGGVTRLSGSGLSMVQWQPFNFLPPLGHQEWQAMFDAYQASPQYKLVNEGMTLAGFKGIFWLEFTHRLWGRLIGIAFLLPFLWFVATGRIGRADAPRLFLLFVLGGLQGALGWFMVASGLVDRPEVSHYRLTAHLMAGLVLYAGLLWSALDYLREADPAPLARGAAVLRRRLLIPLGLLCVTIPAGALVAGLHAGMIYNTFPLMGGTILPSEAFDLVPAWRNFLDNPVLVQFDHRCLAIATWAATILVWLPARSLILPARTRLAVNLVPLAATAQASLGIATLLSVVALPLAAAHQAGGFLLFTVLLWAIHELRAPTPGRMARPGLAQ